ncbi:helix-turn-helix domain-containing protein [Kutzneria kofuensis]|uniref:CBS domain-containing protein n=1 Tax=Kutzneria kofuensis TaxID=103725 RepID=A0A7W9KQ16_9PSEU|nr:helix-turn-helix domain-containing protein [Kutzneria kofuensis]MBB5896328.1 CBS domain-containing protein [Kutzneria kofuensis]
MTSGADVFVVVAARTCHEAAGADPLGGLAHRLGSVRRTADGALVLPAEDKPHGVRRCGEAFAMLPDRVRSGTWLGVAWSGRDVASAEEEARHVAALALFTGKAAGVHRVEDVLVEYAAARNPAVAHRLSAMAGRLVGDLTLHATLRAVISADGDLARASADLGVDRGVLDHRLRRIEQLSGHRPTNPRGLGLLATALAVRETLTGYGITRR